MRLLLGLLFAVGLVAQYVPTPNPGDPLRLSTGAGTGNMTVTTGAGAPSGACTAGQSFYLNTTPSPRELWFCDTSGTWQKILSTLNTGIFIDTGTKGAAPAPPAAGSGLIYFSTADNALHYIDGDTLVNTSIGAGFNPSDLTSVYYREQFGSVTSGGACGTNTFTPGGANTGGQTFAFVSVDLNHAPTCRLTTGATNGNDLAYYLQGATGSLDLTFPSLNSLSGSQAWEFVAIVRLPAITNVTARICLAAAHTDTGDTGTNDICARFSTNAGDTTWRLITCAASTCTGNVDSTVTVTAGTWYKIRLDSSVSGTVGLTVNAATRVSTSSTVPSANLVPVITLLTRTSASANLDVTAPTVFDVTGLTKP